MAHLIIYNLINKSYYSTNELEPLGTKLLKTLPVTGLKKHIKVNQAQKRGTHVQSFGCWGLFLSVVVIHSDSPM